jgi:hypothetical protein
MKEIKEIKEFSLISFISLISYTNTISKGGVTSQEQCEASLWDTTRNENIFLSAKPPCGTTGY